MLRKILISIFISSQVFATSTRPLKIGSTGVPTEFGSSDQALMPFYSANGLLLNASTGLVSSLAPSTSGNVCQSNGTQWVSNSLSTGGIAPNDADYVTISSQAGLTSERRLAVTATNMTLTDGGANSAVTLNTIQNIDTTATPTFQRLLLSGSTNQNFISASGTMDGATGDETAYTLDYTVNKATSGATIGIKSNFTDTSSPGTHHLMELQKSGTANFQVGELGNLSLGNTTETHMFHVVPPTSLKSMAVVPPTETVAASTENTEVTFDLSRTKTFLTGPFATQREMRILGPTYTMNTIDTLDKAVTLSLSGPPIGTAGINITNSYGMEIESRNVTATVSDAISLVVNAPTGAFNSNSAATFLGGNVGVNISQPKTYIHMNPTDLSSARAIVGIDGATRYADAYFGGTQFTSVGGGGAAMMILDQGINYGAATSFALRTLLSLFTLDGANNYTGAVTNSLANTTVRTTAGTATSIIGNQSTITTSNVSTTTTMRPYNAVVTHGGSGTIATMPMYDTSPTISGGGTVTELTGYRFGLPVVSSGTLTTVIGFDVLDQTQTATTKIGYRQRGTNAHNRFNGNTIIGADATPAHKLEVKDGNIALTNSSAADELRFYEASGSGSNYTAFKAQPQGGDVTYTLPAADGTSGQVLSTNASGTLSWVANGTATQVVFMASKGADTSRNSTTTLAADPDLDLTITWANSQKYLLEGAIRVSCASATPDMDFQWQGPAITAGTLAVIYSTTRFGNTNVSLVGSDSTFTNAGTAGTTLDMAAGGEYWMTFSGQFTTSGTPGTNHLQFQWAQNVSSGTNVTVEVGSWMRVSKVQ